MISKTLVVGAGVAGLAAAIALRRAGLGVRVVERGRAPLTRGAGFVLWPDGRQALRELELSDEAERCSNRIARLRRIFLSGSSEEVLDFTALGVGTERAPGRAVLRSALLELLERRLNELGVFVEYGRRLDALEDDGERCRARFAEGALEDAELVIGADGRMASPTRRFVTNDPRDEPRYHGFVNWLGVYAGDRLRFASDEILELRGRSARFGIVPVSPRTAYWAAIGPTAPAEPANVVAARLRRDLAAFPDPVGALLDAAGAATPHLVWVHDLDPIERWHRGRVVLIGDAAHAALPSSGQGASRALADAVALAKLLPCPPAALEGALSEFARQRRGETAALTERARKDARATATGSCK